MVSFLTEHLAIDPSPAIFDKIGTAFRRGVTLRRREHPGGVVHKRDRKIEKMRPYLAAKPRRADPGGRDRGSASTVMFTGTQRVGSNGVPWFSFAKSTAA